MLSEESGMERFLNQTLFYIQLLVYSRLCHHQKSAGQSLNFAKRIMPHLKQSKSLIMFNWKNKSQLLMSSNNHVNQSSKSGGTLIIITGYRHQRASWLKLMSVDTTYVVMKRDALTLFSMMTILPITFGSNVRYNNNNNPKRRLAVVLVRST